MKILKSVIIMIAAAISLGACQSENEEPTFNGDLTDTFEGFFSYYIGYDEAGKRNISSIYPVEGITVSFDDQNRKAQVKVTRLATGRPGAFNYIDLLMTDLPFDTDAEGVRRINADNVDGHGMKMENVKIAYYPDKTVNDTIYHGLSVRIRVDKNNDMTMLPRYPVAFGTTVTTTNSQEPYESTRMIYNIRLNPENSPRTASVTVCNSNFAPNMPVMDMEFASKNPEAINNQGDKMRLELDPGVFRLSADTIVPTITGRPFPSFMILKFKGECDAAKDEMSISFDCRGLGHVEADLSGCYVRQYSPVTK